MDIAILGATSQIAKDLIVSFATHTDYQCVLFSRSSNQVEAWLQSLHIACDFASKAYEDFPAGSYDAIINFVGVGNPARAKEMGAKIFDITYQYDQLALDYIQGNPTCKYIFLSSGAVYGDIFNEPATEDSVARVPVNQLDESYWYTIAKLYAEARHRALPELSIIDIRVFNYFSHTQDISARFLMADIVRAIQEEIVLKTSSENIVRDFLHPDDFFQIIQCVLSAKHLNEAIDCYSKEPVDKDALLKVMKNEFGLQYEIVNHNGYLQPTGTKLCYCSFNKIAETLGYLPKYSALESVVAESELILQG